MVTGFDPSHPTIRWLRSIEERAFLEADAVISVDRPHAEYVRSFGRTGRIWTIVNFVDTRQFNDQVPAVPFDPEVEAWIAGRPVIFCPRRLVPKNGVTAAVRAMAVLKSRGVRVALVVAGYGPQRPEVEALIRELGVAGEVWLLGSVEPGRMPGWYRRSSVVVVPSISIKGVEEATSISALEGQACGRPVIASAIGGLPEIVEDGVTGLLVRGDRPEVLADAIERVLKDEPLAAALGRNAAEFVRAEHSHVAAAREYAAVYATVR
jgi:glycosyltransferase involved in cell wall biosynthesis